MNNKLLNAPILVECCALKHIITFTAECETAGVFHNAKTAIPIRYILNELGHHQLPIPLTMDNNTTDEFIKSNIRQKKIQILGHEVLWVERTMC